MRAKSKLKKPLPNYPLIKGKSIGEIETPRRWTDTPSIGKNKTPYGVARSFGSEKPLTLVRGVSFKEVLQLFLLSFSGKTGRNPKLGLN